MVNETESYWSMRAKNEYLYKGEKLYTITAAPYYVKRREIIIKKLKNIITKYDCRRIVDVGCGDGEYLLKICDENKKYHGIDISTEMLKEAVKIVRITIIFHLNYQKEERKNFMIMTWLMQWQYWLM